MNICKLFSKKRESKTEEHFDNIIGYNNIKRLFSMALGSEVQRIVEKKVSSALKMVPPNEVIPSSLEEDDVKEYINQVIQEVKEKQSET